MGDWCVIKVGKLALGIYAYVLNGHSYGRHTPLISAVLQIGDRALVLDGVAAVHKMDGILAAEVVKAVDQRFLDAVELVRTPWQYTSVYLLLQPQPLEKAGLIDGGRGVGIVFQQFSRACALITKVHASIQAGLFIVPTGGDKVPKALGQGKLLEPVFVPNHLINQFQAHLLQLVGRVFQVVFNLLQGKLIIGAFVPVFFAIYIAEFEAEVIGLSGQI